MGKRKTALYICSVCQKGIYDEFGGYQCPTCGRIICNSCTPEYPLHDAVVVKPNGPEYSKRADMCKFCFDKWLERNRPPTLQMNLFGLATEIERTAKVKNVNSKIAGNESVQKTFA